MGDDNKDLTYSDIQNMDYLDAVICETLRYHCIIAILARVLGPNTEYKIPGTDLILPPNTQVEIDVPAIHFDTEHYANAQNFDPEHFSKEAKARRRGMVKSPCGGGACPGRTRLNSGGPGRDVDELGPGCPSTWTPPAMVGRSSHEEHFSWSRIYL